MSDKRGSNADQFLANAARVLTLSLDDEGTIADLAKLAVPSFADWCFVDLIREDGKSFERVAVGYHDEHGEAIAESLKRRYPISVAEPVGVARAVRDLAPQLLRDLDESFTQQVACDAEHLLAVRALHMRSAVIAPLLARGQSLGALSLISSGRNFDEQDLAFVTQLANIAAPAIHNARLFASERRARIRVSKLQEVTASFSRASTPEEVAEVACRIATEAVEGVSGALWLAQDDGSLELVRSWGAPPEYMDPFLHIPPEASDVPAMHVLLTGEPVWVESAEDYAELAPVIFQRAQAAGRVSAFGAVPLSVNDRITGVMVFAHALGHHYDAADRGYYATLAQNCSQALERARLLETERQLLGSERRSNLRLRLLAEAGEALAESIDLDQTLRAIAKLLVPALADWCVIDLLDGQAIRRVATAHRDPEQVARAERVAARYAARMGDGSAIARVIAEGKTHFYPRLPANLLEKAARDEDELERLRGAGLLSIVVVPLVARGNCIGALSLTTAESGRVYDEADVRFTEELGRRIGLAIANARMRQELERAHERMQLLFMQAPMAIAIYRGAEHRIEFANPAFLQARSRGPEIIGRTHAEVFPEAAGAAQTVLDRAFAFGAPLTFPELEAPLDRGRGPEPAFFHLAVVALRNDEGVVDRVMSVSFEVTERVLARQDLVRERAEVDAARREAEAASQAKDDFLAMLGHELRNPLAPILTALNLMDMRGVAGAERELSVITRQVQHLTRLVDDLLDVSRIIRGMVELVRAPVELSELVARALETASPLFEQRNHYLHVAVAKVGLLIDADAARMVQALSNLLTNAAKYTDPGGHISVTAERSADEVTLRVQDDGVGINSDMLVQIFDLFVQERQGIDRARGGLGLGLAIVKSVVTLHGGSISAAHAKAGRGSVFSLSLPLSASTAGAGTMSQRAAPQRAQGRAAVQHVLVVDDNEDAADLLTIALSAAGHKARQAHDGPSALLALAEFPADVALLDLGLPAMDGYELAAHIRSAHPHVRLIALTGYGQESDRERTRLVGFDEHLVKPVEIATVLETVARVAANLAP